MFICKNLSYHLGNVLIKVGFHKNSEKHLYIQNNTQNNGRKLKPFISFNNQVWLILSYARIIFFSMINHNQECLYKFPFTKARIYYSLLPCNNNKQVREVTSLSSKLIIGEENTLFYLQFNIVIPTNIHNLFV